MNRPASAAKPGQANRRFILVALVLGVIGAILVYAAFSRPSGKGGGGAANTPVVVAKTDIPARTKITDSLVEVRLVTADSASSLGYSDTAAVVGQVTRFPIAANEQILSSKVVPLTGTTSTAAGSVGRSLSYIIPQGKRAMALKTSDIVGAGGLLLPGDYVDVLVVYNIDFPTKADDPSQRSKVESYLIQTILQNVEVLAVSQTIEDVVPSATPTANGQRARNSEAKPDPEAKTVTVALTPEEAEKAFLAESNGTIRLAIRPYGDGDTHPLDQMIQSDIIPRNLPNPFLAR